MIYGGMRSERFVRLDRNIVTLGVSSVGLHGEFSWLPDTRYGRQVLACGCGRCHADDNHHKAHRYVGRFCMFCGRAAQ